MMCWPVLVSFFLLKKFFDSPFIAGIPQCHWYGQHDDFDCIVIDLLGPNVNQLKEFTTKLPMEVVIDFGCQMVHKFFFFYHLH